MVSTSSALKQGAARLHRKRGFLFLLLFSIFLVWTASQWLLVERLLRTSAGNPTWSVHKTPVKRSRAASSSNNNTNDTDHMLPVWDYHTCHAGAQGILRLPKVPHFILAGAQKSGTTALYSLLGKLSPYILQSERFEDHFFDMHYGVQRERLEARYPNESHAAILCRLRQWYTLHLNFTVPKHNNNGTQSMFNLPVLTFEKTPFYLVWPHIPQTISQILPWGVKIIVMLRNPVDRLYSHYQMQHVLRLADKSNRTGDGTGPLPDVLRNQLSLLHKYKLSRAPFLEEYEKAEEALLNSTTLSSPNKTSSVLQSKFDIPPMSRAEQDRLDSISFRGFGNHRENQRYLQRGMYATQLQRWLELDHFYVLNKTLLVLQYEEFQANPRAVLEQVCAFLWNDKHASSWKRLVEERLTGQDFTTIHRPPVEERLLEFLQTAKEQVAVPLSPVTRRYLEAFYRPYNEQLSRLLGNDLKWLWQSPSG